MTGRIDVPLEPLVDRDEVPRAVHAGVADAIAAGMALAARGELTVTTYGGAGHRGGTVAFHQRDGLAGEAHVAGLLISGGTDSLLHATGRRGAVLLTVTADESREQGGEQVDHERARQVLVGLLEAARPFGVTPADLAGMAIGMAGAVDPSSTGPAGIIAPPTEDAETRDPSQQLGRLAQARERASRAVMQRVAHAIAERRPAVDVPMPEVPELTGEPVDDARRLFALTYAQFAALFGITERQAFRWHQAGVPEERRAEVDALVSVGLIVIGGFGPRGARTWLFSGEPSPAQLLRDKRVQELAARADGLRDSVAT